MTHPNSTPIVVHCSAGVGRSGTLIAIDSLIQELREEGHVSIYRLVCELRHSRNYLVQSVVSQLKSFSLRIEKNLYLLVPKNLTTNTIFCRNIIDLPGSQDNHPSLGEDFSLLFLPATPCIHLLPLKGFLKLTRRPLRALASCVASSTTVSLQFVLKHSRR